jgi:HAD superfamily hydrolase (TIGR01509 family)
MGQNLEKFDYGLNMIKLIIFDLDGVLADTEIFHYEAFNKALSDIDPKWVISPHEHEITYKGLPSSKKLDILFNKYSITDLKIKEKILTAKQLYTPALLNKVYKDLDIIGIFEVLKARGYKIAVASNALSKTVTTVLKNIGVYDMVDLFLGNDNVKNPKPSPEIYKKAIQHFGLHPKEALIIEDSPVGQEAAEKSGGNLVKVTSRKDVTLSLIENSIRAIDKSFNSDILVELKKKAI